MRWTKCLVFVLLLLTVAHLPPLPAIEWVGDDEPYSVRELYVLLTGESTADTIAFLQAHPELVTRPMTLIYIDEDTGEIWSSPQNGVQPIHLAARNGRKAIVLWLLNAGASVNAESEDGRQPLAWHVGWQPGDLSLVRVLLDRGADVNHQDQDGRTALMDSYGLMWDCNEELVTELMNHGADLSLRDNLGQTIRDQTLDWRNDNGLSNPRLAKLLYPYYFKIPGVMQFGLLWLVVIAVGLWIRRRRRARPVTVAELAADAGLVPSYEKYLPNPDVPDTELWVRMTRRARQLRTWSVLPVVAGVVVTLFTFQDPMMGYFPTTVLLWIYAGIYVLAYLPFLFVRWTYGLPAYTALGMLFTAFGAFCLGLQGWLFYGYVREVFIFAMYASACGLFVVQTFFLGWITWCYGRLVWWSAGATREARRELAAQENTGIDAKPGWDEVK